MTLSRLRVLVVAGCVVASLARAERLPLRKFTISDGLPHDFVNRIFCDSRGVMWFATREGLARFDGSRFTTLENAPLIAGTRVRDIIEKPAGTYWIATNRGLIRFTAGASVEFARMPIPVNIFTLLAGQKSVWASTDAGIYRIADGAARAVASPPDTANAMIESGNDLWIGTEHGLYLLHDGRELEQLSKESVSTLERDRLGFIWLGAASALTRFRRDPRIDAEHFNEGVHGLPIESILATRDGVLWVGTPLGLARADESDHPTFRSYGLEQGLSDRAIFALAEDAEGDLWAGTESGGVLEMPRSGFTSFTEKDGLADERIRQITTDANGRLLVVTGKNVLHAFDGRRFDQIHPRVPSTLKSFGWGWNEIVAQAPDGEWWMATAEGLARYPATKSIEELSRATPRVYTVGDGMPSNDVFRVFSDTHGDIWVSVVHRGAPLVRFSAGSRTMRVYTTADGMPGDRAPSMFREDRQGNLWIGLFFGGVMRYRNGRFETIVGIPEGTVRDMRVDHAGRLWIATESGGVARIDDTSATTPIIRRYTKEQGLPTNQVYSIVEDRFGRMYFGTSRGISRLDPDSGNVKRYTTADGLPNNMINIAAADHDGTLWFGALQGLASLIPKEDEPTGRPPIWITGVRVSGVPHTIPALGTSSVGPLRLEPHQNRVDLDFESVSLRPGDQVRYQYRVGSDEWSRPSDQRSIALANLAPGTYDVEVRAMTSDGHPSERPALIRFTILPPVWRRWWFTAIAALLTAMAVHLYYRQRTARMLEMERVRVRIASDLHDDIGGSLSRIAILSEAVRQQVDHPRVGSMLSDVAESARSAVEAMSDIVWSIDPRRDDVESLNRRLRQCAAETLDPAGITWIFESDPGADRIKLGPAQRRQVYLVVKEALTNAVRHSSCRLVTITLKSSGNVVHIDIADNGRGFDPGLIDHGHGLGSMRTRLAELGGEVTLTTAEGAGTRLHVSLLLRGTA